MPSVKDTMRANKTFTEKQIQELYESLLYLNMDELKKISDNLSLSTKGNKIVLINAIISFVTTGSICRALVMPAISKVKKGQIIELESNSLMLYGSYKNDAKTRVFFKKFIGQHFHFTAFGIDWLKERWLQGNPPTYQEFANYWCAEYERRKITKEAPKKEWAYINFTQRFLQENPDATKAEIIAAWNLERPIHVQKVFAILGF